MQLIESISRGLAGPLLAFPGAVERVLFRADWIESLFIHFAIEPAILQPHVPLHLDTFSSRAYVSLVAFTQRNLRLIRGGRFAAALTRPIATHEFLNLRTYVRCGEESGIYFIAEWIPNRVACLLGPLSYGLPYRLGRHRYRYEAAEGVAEAVVRAAGGSLRCRARIDSSPVAPAERGTLDHFLLERYAAFTHSRSTSRRFHVAHDSWPRQRVELELIEQSILALGGSWHRDAHFVGANFSPGVAEVLISVPARDITPHSGCGRCFRDR